MEKRKREIGGLLRNGEKAFLGYELLTDDEVSELLETIGESFGKKIPGNIKVGSGVFNLADFAGVKFRPGIGDKE